MENFRPLHQLSSWHQVESRSPTAEPDVRYPSYSDEEESWGMATYTSLPGKSCMRLLRFDTQHSGDLGELHCSLSNYRIGTDPEYSALSYTWGPPRASDLNSNEYYEKTRHINLNGATFPVTRNLHDVLLRLRHSRPYILLWVDAICINQEDLEERNSQVNAMSEIYGNCSEVVVWLGEEDPSTRETVDLIHRIALATNTRDAEGNLINQRRLGHWAFQDPEALALIGLPPITEDQWRNLVLFYSRRWFERQWVVQEIALPRQTMWNWMPSADTLPVDNHVTEAWTTWTSDSASLSQRREAIRLLCGSVVIPWEELLECSLFLNGTGIANGLLELNPMRPDLQNEKIVTSLISLLFHIRGLCRAEFVLRYPTTGCFGTRNLAAWSRAFHLTKDDYDPYAYFCLLQNLLVSWSCTDPRDKIFSLIGIIDRTSAALESSKSHLFAADYSKTIEDVYSDASQAVLQGTRRLDLLLMTPDPAERSYHKLPSWVKDYSVKGTIPLTIYGSDQEPVSHFDAARGYDRADVSFRNNNRLLRVKGLKLGQIADTGEAVDEWNTEYSFEASASLAMKCDEIYINGESRIEALWRTVITNQTEHTHPAPAGAGVLFFQLLRALFRYDILRQFVFSLQNTKIGEQIKTILEPSPNVDKLANCDPSGMMPTMYGDLQSVVQSIREHREFDEIIEVENAAYRKYIDAFYPYMNISLRMRLFRTDNSLLGMGPRSTSEGDEAWVLQGARVPFVLRPNPDTGRYQLMGQAYVHGMMQGEALELDGASWVDVDIE